MFHAGLHRLGYNNFLNSSYKKTAGTAGVLDYLSDSYDYDFHESWQSGWSIRFIIKSWWLSSARITFAPVLKSLTIWN